MAEEQGKLVTCERCGKTVFLKLLAKTKLISSNGGIAVNNDFEPLSDKWLYINQIGHLCDDCTFAFRDWVTFFMNGKVADEWHVDKHRDNKEKPSCE